MKFAFIKAHLVAFPVVSDALKMAIARRNPGQGLLHHSDRGVQYASEDYMHLLQTHDMTISMSGKGDCWDNAAMESFWAMLRTELVKHEHYATREQARASIFEYIEVFYNRKRLHWPAQRCCAALKALAPTAWCIRAEYS